MRSLKKQQGLSAITWLGVIVIAGFGLLCMFKLGPAYMDNIWVRDALSSLTELQRSSDQTWNEISDSEIRGHLSKYFQVNNIRGNIRENIEVERERTRVLVNLNYEKRVDLLANIDVVMTFENQFDSSRPDECCTPLE